MRFQSEASVFNSTVVVCRVLVHFYYKIYLSSLNTSDLEGQGLKQIPELVGHFHYVMRRWARSFD